jgi:hypothetical protein
MTKREYDRMNPLARLINWLKPRPKSPEDIAAEQEAARIRYEMKTTRAASVSGAGENYESQGRRS